MQLKRTNRQLMKITIIRTLIIRKIRNPETTISRRVSLMRKIPQWTRMALVAHQTRKAQPSRQTKIQKTRQHRRRHHHQQLQQLRTKASIMFNHLNFA